MSRMLVDHLGGVPLFSRCSKKDLKILGRHMVEVAVPQDEAIVEQGEPGDAFYILLEGTAKVRIRSGRRVRTVATLQPGSWFGELAVLDPAPRNASVMADTDVVLGVLGARVFKAVVRDVPSMTEHLLAGMARRLREADLELNANL